MSKKADEFIDKYIVGKDDWLLKHKEVISKLLDEYLEAINDTRCCKSDSELLACDCDRKPLRYNELGYCKYCGKQKPSEG